MKISIQHDRAYIEAVKRHLILSDRQKAIFEYRYEHKYSATKMADLLCVSVDTIYAEQGIINKKLANIDEESCSITAMSIRHEWKQQAKETINRASF